MNKHQLDFIGDEDGHSPEIAVVSGIITRINRKDGSVTEEDIPLSETTMLSYCTECGRPLIRKLSWNPFILSL